MTSSRAYDYIVTVSNTSNFEVGNTVFGVLSNTVGEIIGIQGSNLQIKVSNVINQFVTSENIVSLYTPIYSFYTSHSFSATPVVINGTPYAIDGSNKTFPLPATTEFKSEIQVFADGAYVNPDKFEFPSLTLGTSGIDFNNERIITFPNADDTAIASEIVFPSTSVTSLEIAVSRGQPDRLSFIASNTPTVQIETANTTITALYPSNYISNKNSFEEDPIVRLYTIYYPGEWYPPNANNNPTGFGSGKPWPYPFPLRYAEVIGEDFSIPDYKILHEGKEYQSFPINYPGISLDPSGGIGEIVLELSSIDLSIPTLVENSYLVGYNNTSSVVATVNNELVSNIDPRTDPTHVSYDPSIVDKRGGINLAFDYASTNSLGEEWISEIIDSRDLLGAIVEIKSYYASSLEFWPEFSLITSIQGNYITVASTASYRVGDVVKSNESASLGTIHTIYSNNTLQLQESSFPDVTVGDKLFIKNAKYDPNAYVERVFILSKLNFYSDTTVSVALSNRTQELLDLLPRRRFYRNTCPWIYKGVECKYPSSGIGTIANSYPQATANGFFTVNNSSTNDPALDRCAKDIVACRLRNNITNWGGFPGVGDEL